MGLLRKLFLFLLILSTVYILIFISVNFIFQAGLKGFLEKELGAFIDAKVNIKNFKTNLLTQINLDHIHIKRRAKPPFYLDISSVNFQYWPLFLFQARFKGEIELKDLCVYGKDLKIRENILINFSFKPHLFDKVLEIERLTLYLGSIPTLKTKGAIEPIFKPRRLILYAQIASLSYPAFNLKNLSLKLNLSNDESFGDCLIGALNYNKFSLNNISSKIIFQDKKMHLENLEADIFEGRLNGEATISFFPTIGYDLNLKMAGLNLKEISEQLVPPDWQVTGIIAGDLQVSIEGKDLKDLQGRLYSQKVGAVDMKAIKRLLSRAAVVIDKKILKKDTFSYENLTCDISLLKDEIIVKLLLEAKEIELKFDINIEPQVLGSFLNRR